MNDVNNTDLDKMMKSVKNLEKALERTNISKSESLPIGNLTAYLHQVDRRSGSLTLYANDTMAHTNSSLVLNSTVQVSLPEELVADSVNRTVVFCMITLPKHFESQNIMNHQLIGVSISEKNVSGLKSLVNISVYAKPPADKVPKCKFYNISAIVRELKLKRTWVLQQDNDPKHATSPEPNPIEMLWHDLKKARKQFSLNTIRRTVQLMKQISCFLFYPTGFEDTGCFTNWSANEHRITCSCDHLTYFAILMVSPPNISEKDEIVLTYISKVGCGLSLLFLVITVILYCVKWRASADHSQQVHVNLAVALILLNAHFLAVDLATNVPVACIYVAVLLHYSIMATFTWTAIEGFHLYLLLLRVFNIYIRKYLLKISLAGWGVPAVVVILIFIIQPNVYLSMGTFPENSTYTRASQCYISNDVVKNVTILGFFCVVFVFNLIMLVVVVRTLFFQRPVLPGQIRKHRAKNACTVLSITCLLGITWGLIFLSFGQIAIVGLYLFCIFNTLHGECFFIPSITSKSAFTALEQQAVADMTSLFVTVLLILGISGVSGVNALTTCTKEWSSTVVPSQNTSHFNITLNIMGPSGDTITISDNITNLQCTWKSPNTCYIQCDFLNDIRNLNSTMNEKICILKNTSTELHFSLTESKVRCNITQCTDYTLEPLMKGVHYSSELRDLKRLLNIKQMCNPKFKNRTLLHQFIVAEKKYIHEIIKISLQRPTQEYDLEDLAITVVWMNMSNNNSDPVHITSEVSDFLPSLNVMMPVEPFQNVSEAQSKVAVVTYSSASQFMESEAGNVSILSSVVRIEVVDRKVEHLKTPLSINFKLNDNSSVPENFCMSCQYYDDNETAFKWIDNECVNPQNYYKNQNIVNCSYDHMTPFAVLLIDLNVDKTHWDALSYLSYAGCGISIIFSAAAIIIFLIKRKSNADISNNIHVSLSAALLLLNISFLFSELAARWNIEGVCVFVAVLIEYSLLCCFSWAAIEALHVYLLLVKVFNTYIRYYMVKLSLFGWGVPAILVGASLSVYRVKAFYGTKSVIYVGSTVPVKICWITDVNFLYGMNIVYFSLIFLTNTAVLSTVSSQICKLRRLGSKHSRLPTCKDISTVLGLTCLLGMTWGLAFLSSGYTNYPILYLFCILNSLQDPGFSGTRIPCALVLQHCQRHDSNIPRCIEQKMRNCTFSHLRTKNPNLYQKTVETSSTVKVDTVYGHAIHIPSEAVLKSTGGQQNSSSELHLTVSVLNRSLFESPDVPGLADVQRLEYITYIGSSLSVVCTVVVIVMYLCQRKRKAGVSIIIHMQLTGSLFLLHLFFLISTFGSRADKAVCWCLGLMLHWALLATFTWTAVEGYHLYLLLVWVFNINISRYRLKLSLVGWGVPTATVMICGIAGVYGKYTLTENASKTSSLCWVTTEVARYITVNAYLGLVLLFNVAILALTVVKMRELRGRKIKAGNRVKRMWKDWASLLGLSCVLGLPWGFSFLTYGPQSISLPGIYLFTVLNAFQGVLMFLWYLSIRCKSVHEQQPSTKDSSMSNFSS
ncbi:hypothetical protein NFI96_018098 [Prochilodus magdalenae]|nr:hypothetical protein NFI96_018098 [Prochilodus magdalenae]